MFIQLDTSHSDSKASLRVATLPQHPPLRPRKRPGEHSSAIQTVHTAGTVPAVRSKTDAIVMRLPPSELLRSRPRSQSPTGRGEGLIAAAPHRPLIHSPPQNYLTPSPVLKLREEGRPPLQSSLSQPPLLACVLLRSPNPLHPPNLLLYAKRGSSAPPALTKVLNNHPHLPHIGQARRQASCRN